MARRAARRDVEACRVELLREAILIFRWLEPSKLVKGLDPRELRIAVGDATVQGMGARRIIVELEVTYLDAAALFPRPPLGPKISTREGGGTGRILRRL